MKEYYPLRLPEDKIHSQQQGVIFERASNPNASVLSEINKNVKNLYLKKILNSFVEGTPNKLNLVKNILNPKTREKMFKVLDEIESQEYVGEEAYNGYMTKSEPVTGLLLTDNDSYWNTRMVNGREVNKLAAYKRMKLLTNPEIYGIGPNPNRQQYDKLHNFLERAKTEVLPDLLTILDFVADRSANSFTQVHGRAKSADGAVEKIGRMRRGHDGNQSKGDYLFADETDAIGGRIVTEDLEGLEKVMVGLERTFGERGILEKENYYTSGRTRQRPYRLIRYTVLVRGVQCEVQLTTLRSSIVADIYHDIFYKKRTPQMPEGTKDYVDGLRRATTLREHKELATYDFCD